MNEPIKEDPVKVVQDFLDKEGILLRGFPQYVTQKDGTFTTRVMVEVVYKPEVKEEPKS